MREKLIELCNKVNIVDVDERFIDQALEYAGEIKALLEQTKGSTVVLRDIPSEKNISTTTKVIALCTVLLVDESSKRFTELDCRWNGIGAVGAEAIAEALKGGANITALNLRGNGIGAAGAEAIAEAFKEGANKITTLDLGVNGIGAAGAKAIAAALEEGTNITTLNLGGNDIGAAGAEAIIEALKEGANKITTLDLSVNGIGAAGVKAIVEALKEGTNITKIYLDENGSGWIGGEIHDGYKQLLVISILALTCIGVVASSLYLLRNQEKCYNITYCVQEALNGFTDKVTSMWSKLQSPTSPAIN